MESETMKTTLKKKKNKCNSNDMSTILIVIIIRLISNVMNYFFNYLFCFIKLKKSEQFIKMVCEGNCGQQTSARTMSQIIARHQSTSPLISKIGTTCVQLHCRLSRCTERRKL